MTTRSNLAQHGVTLKQAHDFIKANLSSPATIHQVALQYRVDSQMLADIMSIDYPGLSAANVEAFFQSNKLSGPALHNNAPSTSTEQWLHEPLAQLGNLVSLNKNTGALSTQALHDKVVATTGLDNYLYAFAPFNLKGAEDGSLSASDLGVSNLATLAATTENVESLYYGTVITMMQAIDKTELQNIQTFAANNKAALDKDDPTALSQLRTMVIDMLETPATADAAYPSATLAQDVVTATAEVVRLMGLNDETNPLTAVMGYIVGL